MRIGDLASRAGVTAKTVRYYESRGLLEEVPRHANGYRDYGPEALDQLRFIRDAQAAGLSLSEVGEILDMKRAGQATCTHTRALLDTHLSDIDRQVASLLAAKAELLALSARAGTLDPEGCTDPARCQVIAAGHPEMMSDVSSSADLESTIPVRVGA